MPTTSRDGKQLRERVQRDAVVRVVESRHQHQAVGDIEIRVAGRQALAIEIDRLGHGQRDHAQSGAAQQASDSRAAARSSLRIGHPPLTDHHRVLVRRSAPDRRCGRACRRRRCRASARWSGGCPDSRRSSAPARRGRARDCAPGRSLSRHSSVVSNSPAPFTSMLPPSSTMPGSNAAKLDRALRRWPGMRLSSRQLSYLAQPLKSQCVMATSPAVVLHEHRAIVARPASIGRPAQELDGVHVDRAFRQNAPGAFFERRIFHQNADPFHARQVAHDFAIEPRNRREFAGPIGSLVRPCQPRGFVRLPFGRHPPALMQPRQSSHRFRMGA